MSVQLMPVKRSYDRNPRELNGRGKWQKSTAFGADNSALRGSPAKNVIRLLCPASKIGAVIGKGGGIISQIRQETGAKVQIEDTFPGCDERVIVIVGSDKENEVGSGHGKADGEENIITGKGDEGNDTDEHGENDEDKQSVLVEDAQSENVVSSVHKALLLVFERIIDGESKMDERDEGGNKVPSSVLRLLVFSSQVGGLLGKAGSVIKQMSSDSGAQIRILPRDKLPSCASSSDELVQISGGLDAVKKALQSVSQQLLEHLACDQDSLSSNPSGPSSSSFGPCTRQDTFQYSKRSLHGHGPPHSSGFHGVEARFPGRTNPSPGVLSFRLLCPDEKVRGVIGKGGSIVKAVQHETGCEIKVVDAVADSEDRIIVISGPAYPDERISAPQDAVLRVQSRIFRAPPESKEETLKAKLLVSSNQIGCLLGKGGAIIAEMRKSTGAYIRILGKDKIPKCASENEEVVQINGEFERVEEAILQITARLRDHYLRDAFPSMHHPPNPGFLDQIPQFPSFMGRSELSPSGIFSLGPSFHKFDAPGGLPPHGGFHPHNDHSPFAHDFHRPGLPHISERVPSSAPWGPQGGIEDTGPIDFPDYRAPQRRFGGFGGGNHPAIITCTTVEVVVPRSVVPAIYGEEGECLRQIREISDANITINGTKPGATETVIIISGTPEQTSAAQSLIQAFVISETEAA
ncbi:KH domain-containing protein HEN4-like isoform X1 [Olea europaea var. sylvestris]|uniref:KH domain-containing protein HEN4-like isoform X1 n=1 Tax=Olea europaea var. sylvestris TaxID=158386 RepID=UPI000C1CFA0F|nr:KH domain-containing protein HEN4-like isoform X1 [Olea europaea var. sylvestris]